MATWHFNLGDIIKESRPVSEEWLGKRQMNGNTAKITDPIWDSRNSDEPTPFPITDKALPSHGPEVVKRLIAEIRRLRTGLERLRDGDFVGTPINRGCGAQMLIEETLSPETIKPKIP